jgi:hypothetical protein
VLISRSDPFFPFSRTSPQLVPKNVRLSCLQERLSFTGAGRLKTYTTIMSTLRISFLHNLLLVALLILPLTVLAQSQTSTLPSTATASSTYNVFSDIASSSPQQPGNDPGGSSNPGPINPDTAGASGDSQTAITLNTGEQIAIGVVVGLVVLIGIASAILFYLAKKRQWEVKASIRRSARRVTTAFKARTPVRANFSRRDRGGRAVVRIDPPGHTGSEAKGNRDVDRDRTKRSGGILKEGNYKSKRPDRIHTNTGADRDVEKGLGTQTKVETVLRPQPALKSSFEMDSPSTGKQADGKGAGGQGKGRGWMKMLGRM